MTPNFLETSLVLVISGVIIAVGNFTGYKVPINEAVPGMLILFLIVIAGLALSKAVLPGKIPAVAWMTLVGTIIASPICPFADAVVAYVGKINLLATATPALAYAGIALGKDIGAFRHTGWRLVVASFPVFIGTYVGSAIIAHLVLKLQGII